MASANHLESKIRSAIKYHGGKTQLARRIINLITDHEIYLEPFAGGASVLLNKYRAPREILSDVNAELIHFYEYLVQNTDSFIETVKETPFSKKTFLWAKSIPVDVQNPSERALKFYIIQNMSRGGMGLRFASHETDPHETSFRAWQSRQYDLAITADRLRGVEIRCQNAFGALDEFGQDPRVFAYLDPPYYPGTRVDSHIYAYEMTEFEHVQLLTKVKAFSGNVIISGYAVPVYNEYLVGWDQIVIPMVNSSSQEKKKTNREEVLWFKLNCRF